MSRLALGLQHVREAILVHGKAAFVRIERRTKDGEHLDGLSRFAESNGARLERVDRSTLDRLAEGERHQGAIAELPEFALVSVQDLTETSLLVALDEITDPQNFGAIVRSSVALGAGGIIWPEDKSAPLSSSMGRASAGAVEHARLCRVRSLPQALRELTDAAFQVVGLDAHGDVELSQLELAPKVCLVIGAEGKGLRRSTKQACANLAKLPMRGPIASLNASVAAAIALYEVLRRGE